MTNINVKLIIDGIATVESRCCLCGHDSEIKIPESDLNLVLHGHGLIQDRIPHQTPEVREFFISGMCESCQETFFRCHDDAEESA